MPRLEFECQLSVPVDGYGIDDREPKPVIKLREGLSVLRQFEHKAADVLGLIIKRQPANETVALKNKR